MPPYIHLQPKSSKVLRRNWLILTHRSLVETVGPIRRIASLLQRLPSLGIGPIGDVVPLAGGWLLGVNCVSGLRSGASYAQLCLVVLAQMVLFLASGGEKVDEEDKDVEGEYKCDNSRWGTC